MFVHSLLSLVKKPVIFVSFGTLPPCVPSREKNEGSWLLDEVLRCLLYKVSLNPEGLPGGELNEQAWFQGLLCWIMRGFITVYETPFLGTIMGPPQKKKETVGVLGCKSQRLLTHLWNPTGAICRNQLNRLDNVGPSPKSISGQDGFSAGMLAGCMCRFTSSLGRILWFSVYIWRFLCYFRDTVTSYNPQLLDI